MLVLQFVPLGQTSSQVDHGLYGHPSLYPFITTVQLGVSLLYQGNPELIFIRAASVAVVLVFLGQPADERTVRREEKEGDVICECSDLSSM